MKKHSSTYPSPEATFWKPLAQRMIAVNDAEGKSILLFLESLSSQEFYHAIKNGGDHLVAIHGQYGFATDELSSAVRNALRIVKEPLDSMEVFRRQFLDPSWKSRHWETIKQSALIVLKQVDSGMTIIRCVSEGQFHAEFIESAWHVAKAGFEALKLYAEESADIDWEMADCYQQIMRNFQSFLSQVEIEFNETIFPIISADCKQRMFEEMEDTRVHPHHNDSSPLFF